MSANDKTIFVLTDAPELYGESLNQDGYKPSYVANVDSLIDQLRHNDAAGLVLEVRKVMKADRKDRDRIFRYAHQYPLLRTRIDSRKRRLTYLDPKDGFFSNLSAAEGQRKRNHERRKVELDCFLSREEDMTMADSVSGVILDISPGGCAVQTDTMLAEEVFLNVLVPAMPIRRPIFSSVRWALPDKSNPLRILIGLMFIDIDRNQAKIINML